MIKYVTHYQLISQFAGKRVYVYFNLNLKLWSIRHRGLVIAHVSEFQLLDCQPKVSEPGRQRVIAERKKNVHAGIVGTIPDTQLIGPGKLSRITYNPYKYDCFVYADTEERYSGSGFAYFFDNKVYVNAE